MDWNPTRNDPGKTITALCVYFSSACKNEIESVVGKRIMFEYEKANKRIRAFSLLSIYFHFIIYASDFITT